MFEQLLLQPVLPRRAIAAGMGPGFGGVEKQAAAGGGVVKTLRETVGLGVFGEYAEERRAIVVIADAKTNRKRKVVQPAPQPFIVRPVAPIGEIACDHHQLGVAVVGQDVPERALEIMAGIAAADGVAGRGQMDVAHMDEFHGEPRWYEKRGAVAPRWVG